MRSRRYPSISQTPAALLRVQNMIARPHRAEKVNALTGELSGMFGDPAGYAEPLSWVICGGESGAGARPIDPAWVRSLRDQCVEAETPFHFKQWGGFTAKAGGKELDGREWCERPNVSDRIAA